MESKPVKNDIYIKPGFICLPRKPIQLCTVVGSGIVVTIFDTKLMYGGMNYYFKPIRKSPKHSTPIYACPAIIGLTNMFLESNSNIEDLEAHIYGGASNSNADGHHDGLADENIKVALEILDKKKIKITGQDIGGRRGRKVVFNTATGESIVAKVDNIRSLDWYPSIDREDNNNSSFNFN